MAFATAFLPTNKFQDSALELVDPKRDKKQGYLSQRLHSQLIYRTPGFTMNPVSFLTPPCRIISWNHQSGKLVFDIGLHTDFSEFFHAFEQSLFRNVQTLQKTTIGTVATVPLFHSMLNEHYFTTHIYTTLSLQDSYKQTTYFSYVKGDESEDTDETTYKSTTEFTPTTFKKGQFVRLGIQFLGLCFLCDQDTELQSQRLQKYRLQHVLKYIYDV